MKIDIERLATDLEYWNEVAPDGAECRVNDYFAKWENGVELTWDRAGVRGWFSVSNPWPLSRYVKRVGFNVTMKPTPSAWNGDLNADGSQQSWDGLAINVECGRITSLTIPEGLKNGTIRISGKTIKIHQ